MSTTITRLFKTEQQTRDAASALRTLGFTEVHVVTATADQELGTIVDAIVKGGVPKSHGHVYAQHLRTGASLVTVVALYGKSLRATACLARFNPMETEVSEPDVYNRTSNADSIGIPKIYHSSPFTLLLDSNVYFTSFLPLTIDAKPFSKLSTDSKPFSKLLTDSKPFSKLVQGTVSSWLGVSTVSRSREP